MPHGPTFFSDEWRELYRHALREADRLGLEMSLNIQSGWNLGGPMVKPEDAPKKLVWSESRVTGPAKIEQTLPPPKHHPDLYREVAVVAYPVKPAPVADRVACELSASSSRLEQPAALASDGLPETFWVSQGVQSGEGPTRQRPEWLEFRFRQPVAVSGFAVQGRPGYGPTEGELQVSDDGATWRQVQQFSATGDRAEAKFEAVHAAQFRLVFYGVGPAFPRLAAKRADRRVQLLDQAGHALNAVGPQRRPIQNWAQKALHKPLSFSAPDTTPLLEECRRNSAKRTPPQRTCET